MRGSTLINKGIISLGKLILLMVSIKFSTIVSITQFRKLKYDIFG
jgi:hypothetical protein